MTTILPGGAAPIGRDPKQTGFVSSSVPAIDQTQVNSVDPNKGIEKKPAVSENPVTVVNDSHQQTEGITTEHPEMDPNKTVTFGSKPLSSTKSEDIPKINILSFDDPDTDLQELSFRENAAVAVDCMADAAYCLEIGMPNVARYLADQAHETIHALQQQAK